MGADIRTFKALSALLVYPTPELVAAVPEIGAAIAAEGLVGDAAALGPLFDDLGDLDMYEFQARYVDLFDRSRKLSLHLFEHVHGESRDRGQAMVDLAALYRAGGLALAANELPDYLPLFLEFLATRPLAEARALLGDIDHILATLQEGLERRGTPYAAVFAAIRAAAGAEPIAVEAPETAEGDDLAALDAAWEESAVVFGPGEALGGCSVDRLRTQIRAGARDARTAAA